MNKPSIGRIVHAFLRGNWYPAIVTAVHSDTFVNLTVFPDGGSPECRSSMSLLPEGAEPQEINFRWPPRV